MPNIEDRKILNVRQMIIVLLSAISMTFTVTKIYDRFELLEKDMQKIDQVDERHDRKYKRLEGRLEILEKPGTDKSK
jgi:hypothetical protein